MNNAFTDAIKNKSVAIVGPAKYMQDLRLGPEIDEHDIVVRINRSVECIDSFSENIGKTTDILYSCLIEKPANAGTLDVDILCDKYNIQLICAPPKSSMEGISFETTFHDLVDVENIKKIDQKIPVRLVDHIFHTYLAKKVNCRPNTGFLAIYDLLRCKPKKLSIYGFSFYLDGFLPGCKDGIEKERNYSEEEFANKCFVSKRHVQKNMWKLAKKTLLENSVVALDPVLKEILSLDDLSKDQFAEKYENLRSN